MYRLKSRITLICLKCIEKFYCCGYWTKNSFIVALTTFQRVANVQNDHMPLTFVEKKRQNSTAFLLAINPKQIDCVIKFDILRAAEYNKSSTLQVSTLQIVSV